MENLDVLLEKNQKWAEGVQSENPQFFEQLAQSQQPPYLWIGCADSRVPPNTILDLPPGELFVHRNIANLVVENDTSCLAVLQYAVDSLKVQHIIVCGHYSCGGVKAALGPTLDGPIEPWLQSLRSVKDAHIAELEELSPQQQWDRLCELNVMEQVNRVSQSSNVQQAWDRGASLSVHGWIYQLDTGILKKLNVSRSS